MVGADQLSDSGTNRRPISMVHNHAGRHEPDRFLYRLSRLNTAPIDYAIRAEFVRYCMVLFCKRRGYARLANLFRSAPVDVCCSRTNRSDSYLKSLFLVLTYDAHEDFDDGTHQKMAKAVYQEGAHLDHEFVRLANIASDVIQWQMGHETNAIEAEYEAYVEPAWPVLCDELEYEMAEAAEDRFDPSDAYFQHIKDKAEARTKKGAAEQARQDKLNWG